MEAALEKRLEFVIPSDFCECREVQAQILEEVSRCHYDPEAAFAIKLALEEALINAIKHGNHSDRAKTVSVVALITPRQTVITVEDQGNGFDRSRVPDPTADANLERLHGRGILLMEAYMDRVQFSHGGRRVRMVRKNRPGCPELARPAR